MGAGAEWDVYPGEGPIQDAIDGAGVGDTIYVYEGTYVENVDVNKQLTLRGIDMPVVDAGRSGDVITLSADGVVVEGFMATKSGYWGDAGIKVTSSNNTITGNTFSNNDWDGIGIFYYSSNNKIYLNNLIDNTQNAHDYCTNQWDSGSEGNYWSDYTGTDSCRDGIGDDPYDIPGGTSVDRYPLTGIHWLPPEIPRSRLGINTHWYKWAEDFPAYKEKIKNFGIIRDGAWGMWKGSIH